MERAIQSTKPLARSMAARITRLRDKAQKWRLAAHPDGVTDPGLHDAALVPRKPKRVFEVS